MTSEQKAIFDYIVNYIQDHQYPPSIREIAKNVGYRSTSSVHHHLEKMYEEGVLETDAGLDRARAIRIPGYRFVKEVNYSKK